MSILLIFCVLAAAGWLLLSVVGRDTSDRPDASVAAYSRAMAALSPDESPTGVAHQRPAHATTPRSRARTAPPRHRSAAPRRRSGATPRPSARR